MAFTQSFDVEDVITRLTLEEKVTLLSGAGRCALASVERLNVPKINTSDGPHGLRGYSFWNGPRGLMLPCGTAMGATFDHELLHRVGNMLADEARGKNIHVVLGPVVCLQRSPLIGRGFEAFGEDPFMSGNLAACYINGLQERKVASCIKHYAAHDQSLRATEDDVVMTDRTLREAHLLPFQIALKKSNPGAIMTSYNRINGIHASEDSYLINQILREEWKWDGLVLSDWWGTYSTSGSINAGMDLEMPGPPVWRGGLLINAVSCRKVTMATVDASVRKVLTLISKVSDPGPTSIKQLNDTAETRSFARRVAGESIVLLKNEKSILPLGKADKKSYGLIGGHFKVPATCGGGSSELDPYYVSTPLDAIIEIVGKENVTYLPGCYSHKFTPLITTGLTQPGSQEPGLLLEFFGKNPEVIKAAAENPCLFTTHTVSTSMPFNDSIPLFLPSVYFIRVRTTYTAEKAAKYRFGLSISGRAKLSIDGKLAIDQWTSLPEKTDDTPVFNSFTMESLADLDTKAGQNYEIEVLLTNDAIDTTIVGAAPAAGLRIGMYEVIDEDSSIAEAVELAKRVDVPIVLTGLSSDYEYENKDRKDLVLPGRINELISRVLEANPKTIVITQSGLPIGMPWVHQASTLLHAWFGGQEVGHGIADVLFGTVNPSAKLSVTFPKRAEDTPTFLTFGKADRSLVYGEGVFIGYRYYEKIDLAPLFYFGYGLSYTQFKYSNLVVPAEFVAEEEHVMTIELELTNTGKIDGAEVVQVYVADLQASVQRPRKELKGFKKVAVAAGKSTKVEVTLDKYAISFWSEEHSTWLAEAGEFLVIISTSADPKDEVLQSKFVLRKDLLWSGV
ncbi:glycoside hydrolase superfamily [Leptodontidium sp. MPI-SDFR-AT-0119]|nr:glycoside hydrolase superfamily [Leptodontidium sp. MPI-SDFR-AT-0119]